jgi:hypothetical protein
VQVAGVETRRTTVDTIIDADVTARLQDYHDRAAQRAADDAAEMTIAAARMQKIADEHAGLTARLFAISTRIEAALAEIEALADVADYLDSSGDETDLTRAMDAVLYPTAERLRAAALKFDRGMGIEPPPMCECERRARTARYDALRAAAA